MSVGVAVVYFRRLQRVKEEYVKAKGVIEDVLVSFNEDINKHDQKLNNITQTIRDLSSQSEKIIRKIEVRNEQLVTLHAKMEDFSIVDQKIDSHYREIEQKIEKTSNVQETIIKKIEELEKSKQKELSIPKIETEGVLPIKKEIALGPLTETELKVLETIASEGEKTAPQIRGRVELSREHTSRLMRKLYENGYLERDTRRTPYVYRLKKEMTRILNR